MSISREALKILKMRLRRIKTSCSFDTQESCLRIHDGQSIPTIPKKLFHEKVTYTYVKTLKRIEVYMIMVVHLTKITLHSKNVPAQTTPFQLKHNRQEIRHLQLLNDKLYNQCNVYKCVSLM